MALRPLSHFYVYVLFRENGQPFYVGYGQNDRWLNHETDARKGRHGHRFNIIRKMQAAGFEIPKIKLHENLTEAVAKQYERSLILAIGRMPNGPLVNLTDGGDGASNPSPEVRAKLGNRSSEATDRLRAVMQTPEYRAKMSAANSGKVRSAETRAKLAEIARNASVETRAKIAETVRRQMTGERLAKFFAAAHTPEAVAKAAASRTNPSPETRAKMSAAKRNPETIARLAAMSRKAAALYWARKCNVP